MALAISTAALGTGAMFATSATAAGTANAPVHPGITPSSVPGAKPFGNTPASTPETVSFILKEQNQGQLSYNVEHGIRSFLSVSQFASQYGQPQSYIDQLTSYLAGYGIKTQVYGDHVDVVATGTAGQFDKALNTKQSEYTAPATPAHNGFSGHPAQTFHGADSAYLPQNLAANVTAILGLTNYAAFQSDAQRVDTGVAKPHADSSSSCEQLTGLPSACHLPQDYAGQYKLSGLYSRGATGKGTTVGIVTLAALDPDAPQYFWSNVAKLPASGRTVTVDNVDGGPGAPSDAAGSGETDLDVEQAGGVAPDANVIVYQAANTDSGFADAFFSAATQNVADSVSASWGESETLVQDAVAQGIETPAYEAAFDEAFMELAAQGQSAFTSAGDEGAYTASNPADLGTTNLAADASADSPYITSAGGTTLPWSATLTNSGGTSATIDVPAERAWGWDYLWAPVATLEGISYADSATSQVAGGGGGFSVLEPEPSYQQGVSGTSRFKAVDNLTPTDYQTVGALTLPTAWTVNQNPAIVSGSGSGRAQPDVSADADPYSGYLLYEPSATAAGNPALQGGWGGTSYVAPQFNGSAAVIDSYLGHRVGFWNPRMYAAAASPNSPVTPLNTTGSSNDNIYYTGTPGTLFNEATGLGVPNLAKLASDF